MASVLLNRSRVIVTCGTGGVGKTTLSSSLAVQAALEGKRSVVITVDPAKRLRTSLGVEHLGDEPTDLTPLLESSLGKKISGRLDAIVPDTRKTFEDFVHEISPNAAITSRILSNPIFQIFAREFSGSNEYMALERLLKLYETSDYDFIVLDTPPSRNTLAFLNAPALLAQFFEERLVKNLLLPANRLFSAGIKKTLGLLEGLTGGTFVNHLFEFATDIVEVQTRFLSNLGRFKSLMASPDVGFVMVAAPHPEFIPEVGHFLKTLRTNHLRCEGVILNRCLSQIDAGARSQVAAQVERKDPPLTRALQLFEGLSTAESATLQAIGQLEVQILARVPELSRDVHSLADLIVIAENLTQP